jgi:hypothetical protein
MDSLVQTNLHTEALIARFRAERSTKRTGADGARAHANQSTSDSVEISATATTSTTVNGVVNDSVVEQINKAIQEAGIDLRIETDGSFAVSPEGAARRITDFATGYLDAYSESRASQPVEQQIDGFMSLIRGAIEEGFSNARDFLSGVTKLSETLSKAIDRTFELTQGYLSDFRSAQLAASQPDPVDPPADETEGAML